MVAGLQRVMADYVQFLRYPLDTLPVYYPLDTLPVLQTYGYGYPG